MLFFCSDKLSNDLILHTEKESWVPDNLIQYYLISKSSMAADLIVASRIEHEKVSVACIHLPFLVDISRN